MPLLRTPPSASILPNFIPSPRIGAFGQPAKKIADFAPEGRKDDRNRYVCYSRYVRSPPIAPVYGAPDDLHEVERSFPPPPHT